VYHGCGSLDPRITEFSVIVSVDSEVLEDEVPGEAAYDICETCGNYNQWCTVCKSYIGCFDTPYHCAVWDGEGIWHAVVCYDCCGKLDGCDQDDP
jgi:hypothetical protein